MASSVSISMAVAAWAACVLFCGTSWDIMSMAFAAAASESSSLQLEAKTLRESGWWSRNETSNSSGPCEWYGIACNAGGSVTGIRLAGVNLEAKPKLNFTSLPNLVRLELRGTRLRGSIPAEIGTLSKLTHLDLSYNNLVGEFPLPLTNLTRLVELDISLNEISGFIPKRIENLKNLVKLDLGENNFIGPIPWTLCLLTNLTHLDVSSNPLNGSLPEEIGNLKNLVQLRLSGNNLMGPIPSSLWLLSNLTYLDMSSNQINDFIVGSGVEKLKNLVFLDLRDNMLIGPIPSNIGSLTRLRYLNLRNNKIHGSIPPEIGNMKDLSYLSLEGNRLHSQIPSTIGDLTNLRTLFLDENQITGSIPTEIGNLKKLTHLIFNANNLSGSIPTQLTSCSFLEDLLLSNNSLSGSIPYQIDDLYLLQTIDLRHNYISGKIPLELGSLAFLTLLDLSYNNLTGNIPLSFASVQNINLSYNFLGGQIPDSFRNRSANILVGNKDLCGHDFIGFLPCLSSVPAHNNSSTANKKSVLTKIEVLVPISMSLAFFVLGVFLLFRLIRVKKKGSNSRDDPKNGNMFSIWNYDGHIAYEDIIKATNDFDIRYCIGTGGYGSVYKAELPNSRVVALKKLHHWEAENQAFEESFKNEVKVLTEIRHRHIIKLHGFCLHKQCMFLVYEYMERGSLFCILNNDVEAVELNWSKRVNIIKGISHALSYLHHECIPPIVHRDISSSNVLLNSKLEAFVSDFGTAKLLDPDSSNRTLAVGTYGYVAPDIRLPPPNHRLERDVLLVAKMAFACLRPEPKSRPTMKWVSQGFLSQKKPTAKPLHTVSLWQLRNQDMHDIGESQIQSGNDACG
ncbi:hypothetical protein CJ030_MR8G020728 [Morella rubra]|uniref:non-specific serine/threonine protein kinase n=1 Tax=Morella rubra TaxID=262757 RepID=A0A6A1UUJ4_9ROSI|nr:hypothetical protein CJ030_MR8G020728 [Morella rubra]